MMPSSLAHAARSTPVRRRPGRCLRLFLLAAVCLPAAACSNVDRTVATSAIPVDYHERHPVVLADTPQTLDVFLLGQGGTFDYRQKHDIEAFTADYLAHGEGRIRVLVPRGEADHARGETTLAAVQRGLAASGVKGDIEVGSYRVAEPRAATTVRLSFVKLQARAASHCGDWPSDLGPGTNIDGWDNRSYYNLGCATQQTLAAQMDDPRDLVRPRADDPSDVQMRTRPIQLLRGSQPAPVSQDPSTPWGTHIIPITSLTSQ